MSLSETDRTAAPTAFPTSTLDASETPTPTPECVISVDREEIYVPGCSRPENLRGTLHVSTIPSDCCWNAFSNGLVTIEPTEGCGDADVSYVIRIPARRARLRPEPLDTCPPSDQSESCAGIAQG